MSLCVDKKNYFPVSGYLHKTHDLYELHTWARDLITWYWKYAINQGCMSTYKPLTQEWEGRTGGNLWSRRFSFPWSPRILSIIWNRGDHLQNAKITWVRNMSCRHLCWGFAFDFDNFLYAISNFWDNQDQGTAPLLLLMLQFITYG